MDRKGLMVALLIGLLVGIVFAINPKLDLQIAAPFYDVADRDGNQFALRIYPPLRHAHDIALWLVVALATSSTLILLNKAIRRNGIRSTRAIAFLLMSFALGPGLLVNVLLKDHWGRPRPIDVTQFGGDQHFVSWWDPRGDCPRNCSFVSGDVSSAFWTIAPAALAPPQWRLLAYTAAVFFGVAMAVSRIVVGAHFFTDTVFAGVFTFLLVWLLYALIIRRAEND